MEQPRSGLFVEVCFTFGWIFYYAQIIMTAVKRCGVALIPAVTSHSERRTSVEVAWEQSAEENIWVQDIWNYGKMKNIM
jgi:hypothetical protein